MINGISFAVSKIHKKRPHTHKHIILHQLLSFVFKIVRLSMKCTLSAFLSILHFYAIPTRCHFLTKIYCAHISHHKCLHLISAQGVINGTSISTETHLRVRANCLILYVISTGSNFFKGREVVCV